MEAIDVSNFNLSNINFVKKIHSKRQRGIKCHHEAKIILPMLKLYANYGFH